MFSFTFFLARYLRSRALQPEIHEGLNVVESWNRANTVIFYGKRRRHAARRADSALVRGNRLRKPSASKSVSTQLPMC